MSRLADNWLPAVLATNIDGDTPADLAASLEAPEKIKKRIDELTAFATEKVRILENVLCSALAILKFTIKKSALVTTTSFCLCHMNRRPRTLSQ
jgi:hypothetical protein